MFGLFPLSIAVGVMLISWRYFGDKVGTWIWIIAPAMGIGSWALYWLAVKMFAVWLDRQEAQKWKWQNENRTYLDFDQTKGYTAGTKLYYECLTCGNAIPSISKKNVSCTCRNIVVDTSGHVTIKTHEKIKIFAVK